VVTSLLLYSGCGFFEDDVASSESKSNPHEARIVSKIVISLLACNVSPSAIGIITPYNAQVCSTGSPLAQTLCLLRLD